MHVHDWRRLRAIGPIMVTVLILIAACSSPAAAPPEATPTPTEEPTPTDEPTPSEEPSDEGGTGEPSVDGPDEIMAGAEITVSWTGPDGRGDYVTIVPAGASEWTNGDPYFYTADGSPGTLVAPTAEGEYELWYVTGEDEDVLAQAPITVTPFDGDLLAPAEVAGGEEFEVAWNGPDGPGDYVTIVPAGAERWTNESYFYTYIGDPGTLIAPIEAGDYEIWYVTGDGETQATRPIVVQALEVTLDAPATVSAGDTFEVEWTGPDGNGDYITIVAAGSPEGSYLDYAYTYEGNPVTITAPTETGAYEIWYASDRVDGTFESIPIIVN